MEYEIRRSNRRTMSLTVDKNSGSVIVRAPLGVPAEKIESFVTSKLGWVTKHTDEAKERGNARVQRLSDNPTELPFLGEMCPVDHDKPYGYSDGHFHLPDNVSLEKLIPYLRRLYSGIAKETLTSRTRLLADRMGIAVTNVRINSARTRWGSCSSEGSINLSWKLIAADPGLIDYVIVHELCHTVHMDHSPAFWETVEQVIPDYTERRTALKEVQKNLSEFGLD